MIVIDHIIQNFNVILMLSYVDEQTVTQLELRMMECGCDMPFSLAVNLNVISYKHAYVVK
jgi:hypothetical protein